MHHSSSDKNCPVISDIASRNVFINQRTYCCTRDGAAVKAFIPNTDKMPAQTAFAHTFDTVSEAKAWMNNPKI